MDTFHGHIVFITFRLHLLGTLLARARRNLIIYELEILTVETDRFLI
jgi:hypothetical protein